jgi:hypothetical protein
MYDFCIVEGTNVVKKIRGVWSKKRYQHDVGRQEEVCIGVDAISFKDQ